MNRKPLDSDEDEPKRNENGDIIFPQLSQEFYERIRKNDFVYVFRKKIGEEYFPIYDFVQDEINPRFDKLKIERYQIFKSNSESFDKSLFKYESLFKKYFNYVFAEEAISKRNGLGINKYIFYLEKNTLNEIKDFIRKFSLDEYSDFIFFLIAKIQEYYFNKIHFYVSPDQIERIKNYPIEVKKLMQILDWTELYSLKPNIPELKAIAFKFGYLKETTLTIKDKFLHYGIINSYKKDLSNGKEGQWRRYEKNTLNRNAEYKSKQKFFKTIVKTLHNFFIGEKIFKLIKNKTTSDQAILCSAYLLEFAHIHIYNRKNKRYLFLPGDSAQIIKNYRHYLRKSKVINLPNEISFNVNKNILYQYFAKSVIDWVDVKNTLPEAKPIIDICYTFEIEHIMNEIIHLSKILEKSRHFFKSQIHDLYHCQKEQLSIEQYFKAIDFFKNSTQSVKRINIVLENDEVIEINNNLLLSHVKKGMHEHYKENSLDYEFDLGYTENNIFIFNKNCERFLPGFCLSFFIFLKNEARMSKKEFQPSERFCEIITHVLANTYYFQGNYNIHLSECNKERGMQKVMNWISLAREKNSNS